MADLSQETIKLLDRLFNLKGEENVIIKRIEEEINNTEDLIEAEGRTQTDNEVAKVDCEGKLSVFETQRGIFESAFAGLDNETFSALREIGVNIEIGTMLEVLADKSPDFCSELQRQIEEYQKAIDENKEKKNKLYGELSELANSRSQNIDSREKLVSLLEQSLSSDELERESLSTSYVKKILSLFDMFSAEEIAVLTKLIIFPDDGLYKYAESYEERLSQGLVNLDDTVVVDEKVPEETVELEDAPADDLVEEVIPEVPAEEIYGDDGLTVIDSAKEDVHEVVADTYQDIVVSEPSVLNQETSLIDLTSLNSSLADEVEEAPVLYPAEDEVVELTSDDKVADLEVGEIEEPEESVLPVEPVALEGNDGKEEVQPKEDDIEEFLGSIGLDASRLNGALQVFSDVPHKVIESNYELLRSIDASQNAIYVSGNVEGTEHLYLADLDLSKKVTLLRAKGISEHKIKELLDSNDTLRVSYEELEEKVNAIVSSMGKVEDDNIDLISSNVVLYDKNCRELASFGFELEEKELRNGRELLMTSPNVPTDLRVLKDYLISLVRTNGKYALTPFWKSQVELVTDIDDLIEAGLAGLFEQDPEVLGQDCSEVIKRVRYCEKQGIPVYDGDDKTSFCDYIVNYAKFFSEYGQVKDVSLEDRTAVNEMLPSIIGNEDYVGILKGILDEHYANAVRVSEINLENEDVEDDFEDLKALANDMFGAVPSGKFTYRIGEVTVSKNKFERQLSVILNALANSGQSVDGVEKEVLLTAALYNLRKDENTLRKVADSGLGFNENTVGGKSL